MSKNILLFVLISFCTLSHAQTEKADSSKNKIEDITTIYQVVQQMPGFPGGDAALIKFLNESVKYPKYAIKNGIQGKVFCTLVIDTDGSIKNVEVVKSVHPLLDKEAVRVIESMPKWTPGYDRGKAVRVKYTLPINFRLQ